MIGGAAGYLSRKKDLIFAPKWPTTWAKRQIYMIYCLCRNTLRLHNPMYIYIYHTVSFWTNKMCYIRGLLFHWTNTKMWRIYCSASIILPCSLIPRIPESLIIKTHLPSWPLQSQGPKSKPSLYLVVLLKSQDEPTFKKHLLWTCQLTGCGQAQNPAGYFTRAL